MMPIKRSLAISRIGWVLRTLLGLLLLRIHTAMGELNDEKKYSGKDKIDGNANSPRIAFNKRPNAEGFILPAERSVAFA